MDYTQTELLSVTERHLPLMTKVSANVRHRTTDVVISSADLASSWRCGDIGGVVAVGDAGADEPLAAAGAGAGDGGASAAGAAAAVSPSSPLAAAAGTGSFFGVSSLSNQM